MKCRLMLHFIWVFLVCKRWQLVRLLKYWLGLAVRVQLKRLAKSWLAWLSPDIIVKGDYWNGFVRPFIGMYVRLSTRTSNSVFFVSSTPLIVDSILKVLHMFCAWANEHVAHELINFGDLRCSEWILREHNSSNCISFPVHSCPVVSCIFSSNFDMDILSHMLPWHLTDNSVQPAPVPPQFDWLKTAYKNTSFGHIFDRMYIHNGFKPHLTHTWNMQCV